jgi:hypothetical protein
MQGCPVGGDPVDTDRLEEGPLFILTGLLLIAFIAEMLALAPDVIALPVVRMIVGGALLIGKDLLGRVDCSAQPAADPRGGVHRGWNWRCGNGTT